MLNGGRIQPSPLMGRHGSRSQADEHEPNSDPAMVVIKSVNPEYQTYERMADEVHIVGRVVWTSRRL